MGPLVVAARRATGPLDRRPRRLGIAACRARRLAHSRQDRAHALRHAADATDAALARRSAAAVARGVHAAESFARCRGSCMTPEQYVQDKAAKSGSSFYYAFLFLPPPRRAAITAFYAFCREVDDVVDQVSDHGVAAVKLAWWRSEIGASFAGTPSHPVMRALMPHCAPFGIEARHLLAVVEGCQ